MRHFITIDKDEWTKIGTISVDAGLCWIGDPCYVLHTELPKELGKDWRQFCDKLEDFYTVFNRGCCVETGYGDGSYPVYIRYNDAGDNWGTRVRGVFIDFDNLMNNDDEEDED